MLLFLLELLVISFESLHFFVEVVIHLDFDWLVIMPSYITCYR
jgi:hypothetical protein